MRRYIFLLLLVLSGSQLFGQGDNKFLIHQIDSLKHQLTGILQDSTRAEALRLISASYMHINPDSSIYYGKQAIILFEKTKNFRKRAFATGQMMEAYIEQGNLPEALDDGLNTLEEAAKLEVRESGIGPTNDNLGLIYYYLGDYKKSLYYYQQNILRGDVDLGGEAFGYLGQALVFEKLNKLDSALLLLERSRNAFHEWNNISNPDDINPDAPYQYEVYPAWYNIRAKIYLKQNRPDLALADLRTTLAITLESTEIFHTSSTYNDIADYYKKLIQSDSVIYYAERGLAEANKISFIEGILNSSTLLAKQYESTNPAKALYYYKLADETRNKLYGAGNIQLMKDLIAQKERRQAEAKASEIEFRNRLRMNVLQGSLFTLVLVAIILYRNNRVKQKAKQKVEQAYDRLKATQAQLVQSEKMASLGELTAGIAHEIQNPLNFVNNFSELNSELIEEQKTELEKGNMDGVKILANEIGENEKKIVHHGKRADAIVKGMLQHSRSSNGSKEPTDLNTLTDEYLRLAYHGIRAKDSTFNVTLKTDFDKTIGLVDVIPQDIGRVILNLITNAFYAVTEKSKENADKGFEPTVSVATKNEGDKVSISVKDNGDGIPPNVLDKIFQPFFTTKPTGQGTGLGLSLSYDIVVKGHGGDLKVESKEKHETEFIVQLPIN